MNIVTTATQTESENTLKWAFFQINIDNIFLLKIIYCFENCKIIVNQFFVCLKAKL